jgi:preprotein translocase subunit SecD
MDALNITDREVTVDLTAGKIIVRFPWKSHETDFDAQKAVSELGETAKLTFRDPDGNVVLEGTEVVESYATLSPQDSSPIVVLKLSENGRVKFSEATGRLVWQGKSQFTWMRLLSPHPRCRVKSTAIPPKSTA